jgi:type II secretory pathway component PulM
VSARAALADRWAALAPRERALLVAAAAISATFAAWLGVALVRDDLAALRARVAGRERELAAVRQLAATLASDPAPVALDPADAPSLLARLEDAAAAVVGRERIVEMTPAADAAADDGERAERIALRVSDASLAEVVRLLHDLETEPGLAVARLELRKHADDPGRFAATLEVARLATAPAAEGTP